MTTVLLASDLFHLPLAIMGIGPMEMIIVGIVGVLLFGNRLPSVMRSLGRGVIEFKKGVQGIDDENADANADETPQSKP